MLKKMFMARINEYFDLFKTTTQAITKCVDFY